MADTVRFVIDVETPGEAKLGRFKSSLAELQGLSAKAGAGLQSFAATAGANLQTMAGRAGGALGGIREQLTHLTTRFGAFGTAARAALERVALNFGTLGRAAVSAVSSLASFGAAGAGLAVGLGVLVGVLVAIVKVFKELREAIPRVVQQATELEKMSRRLQIPADVLSGLSFAAKQAEVSLADIGLGLRGLAKAFGDVGREGTDANKVLIRDLKFTAAQLQALRGDPQRALLEIGDRFNQMADGLGKARAAQALFGRGYQAILQLFAEGRPELEKNIALAQRLNVAFGEDTIRAGARLGDAWTTLGAAIDGVFNRIAGSPRLLNGLASLIERLALAASDFGAALTPARVDAFVGAMGRLVAIMERLVGLVGSFARFIATFPNSLGDLFREAPAAPAPAFDPQSAHGRSQATALSELRAFAQEAKGDFGPLGGGKGEKNFTDELNRGLEELRRKLREARGELDPTEAKVEDLVASFAKFGKAGQDAARHIATELVKTQEAEADFLRDIDRQLEDVGEPSGAALQKLAGIRQQIEERATPNLTAGYLDALRRVDAETHKFNRDLQQLGTTLERDLRQRLERAQDPAAGLRQEFDGIRQEANRLADPALRNVVLGLANATEEAERTQGAFFDLFGALERGSGDVFEALILGTRDVADAFEGLKLSIARSFVESFTEGLKAKVGFEGAFKLNLVQFGQNITGILGSIFGGGTAGSGSGGALSKLFSGVFGSGGAAGAPGGGGGLGLTSLIGIAGIAQGVGQLTTGLSGSDFGRNRALQGLVLQALGGLGRAFAPQLASLFGGLIGGGGTAGAGIAGAEAASGAFIGEGAGSAAAGAAGSLGALISVVGALVSIASAVKGTIDTSNQLSKVSLGDRSAGRFKTTGLVATGLGVGIGAGIGAAVGAAGGPIGAVVGAAVGAGIAAAITQAVNSAVGTAIGKGTIEARKKGLTQEEFASTVKGNLGIQILSALGIVGVPGDSGKGLDVLGLIPDIEVIFNKIFTKFFQQLTGVLVNRQAATTPLTRDERERRRGFTAAGLTDDARTLARLLSSLIGSGTDNAERIQRFANILVNTAVQQQQTAAQFADLIFKAVRGLGGDRLGETLGLVTRLFRDGQVEQTNREERFLTKTLDLVARSFERIAPQLDVRAIANVLRNTGALRPTILRRARRAARAAVPALFGGGTTAESIRGFLDAVANRLQEVIERRLGKVVTNLLDAFLAPLFNGIDRAIRVLKRKGLDEGLGRALIELERANADFAALIGTGGFLKLLTQIIELGQKFDELIFAGTVQAAVAAGDIVGATEAIRNRLQPFIDTFKGFRQLGRDIDARVNTALAGGGVAGEQARIAALGQARFEAQAALAPLGITETKRGLAFDPTKFVGDTQEALRLLQEFADLRLQELEGELNLARQQRDFWRQVRETFEGFRENIMQIRGGQRAGFDIFRTRQAELTGLLGAARGPESEERDRALSRISQIIPELLQLGTELFAPGSAQLSGLLDFLDSISKEFINLATAGEDRAVSKLEAVRKELGDFRTDIKPIIDFFTERSKSDLKSQIDRLVEVLGANGDIYKILESIAQGLGIQIGPPPPPTPGVGDDDQTPDVPFVPPGSEPEAPDIPFRPRQFGGPVMPFQRYLVGEAGPEIFQPSTPGTIIPNHQLAGPNISVPITIAEGAIQISGVRDPREAAAQVADALLSRQAHRLEQEIKRIVGQGI